MPSSSYLTSMISLYFGASTGVAGDLMEHLRDSLSIPGNVSTHRERVLASGIPGMTADAVSMGLSVSGSFRQDEDIEDVIDLETGFLFVHRKDAGFAYAFPAILEAFPTTSPAGGVVSVSLTFRQGTGGNLIAGAPVTSGSLTLSTDQEGYIVNTASGVSKRVTATTALASNEIGVAGDPFIAP